jgi:hypothetical protein
MSLSKRIRLDISIKAICQFDDLPCRIDSPVQIFSLASDFDVSFIHSSPTTLLAFMPTKDLNQHEC